MVRNEKKTHRISKEHILDLGGTEDDLDLLKEVDEHTVTGTVNKDPALSTDVSNFLQDLKQQSNSKHKAKGKERETPPKPLVRKQKAASALAKGERPSLTEKSNSNPRLFTFHPVAQWHAALPLLGTPADSVTPTQLSALSAKAGQLHENDVRIFQTSSPAGTVSSEANFLSKIIHAGTLSDRLSALTLLVQSSPLHNVKALETLKGMAERGKGKGGREESLKALRCIVDWWIGGGAPDRKLKYFRDQPLLHPDVTDEYLLLWYFEDWLKKYFFSILQILETLSLDPLPYIRTQTITLIFTLLRDKPEQEQNLLRLLVNKLGDTEKSLCSRASYHILQLLQTHPSMKAIVVREIMALVLKPSVAASASTSVPQQGKHIRFSDKKDSASSRRTSGEKDKKGGNAHARYYASVTFNQIVLTPSDRGVAVTLLDIYFQMFNEILGEKDEGEKEEEETEERSEDGDIAVVKTDKKGRVLDHKKGNKGKEKALNRSKGAAGFMEVEDSSSKVISAILTGINRALPFANMDADDSVLNKHIDTLFLITHTSTFNISLQALLLIQQISSSLSSSNKPHLSSAVTKSVTDRYYRALYASLHDTRLASSSKQAMYLNLFFKSVKADGNNERVKALVRRFTQVLVSAGGGATEFVAGGLYVLGELFSCIPGLRVMLNHPPPPKVPSDEEKYDPKKRDPQYVHAESSPLWELIPLLHHYHPAVALHARQLLSSHSLTASPDLSQNTLSHFLDRFVYKNPKKLKPREGDADGTRLGKGPSAMQPAASAVEGVKLIRGEVGYIGEEVVNEKAFLRKKRENVPADQVFFHDYFTRKDRKERSLKEKQGDTSAKSDQEDDDDESRGEGARESGSDSGEDIDSDAEEAEIWKVMQATMPKVDEDGDLMDDSEEDGEDDEEVMFDDGDSDLRHSDESDRDDDGQDSEGDLSLAEASDDEDLIPLDEMEPEALIEYDGSDAEEEEEEWHGISGIGKRKRTDDEKGNGKRKKSRSLPTFASYEDYAKLIEQGPEDDI